MIQKENNHEGFPDFIEHENDSDDHILLTQENT